MEFGELNEPTTRAFWDNYDEYDVESEQPITLSWKWMDDDAANQNNVRPCKRFYVIEGHRICDFVNNTILKKISPLCQLDGYKTAVYKLPNTDDYICVTESNDIDRMAQITELLTPWLKVSKQTYSFSIQPIYSFNTTAYVDERCVIRIISNRDNSNAELDFLKPLEDCNIINGVSAGVSSWRFNNKLPFSCFAIYIDSPSVDAVAAKPILKLFKALGLQCDSNYDLKNANNSNLYV